MNSDRSDLCFNPEYVFIKKEVNITLNDEFNRCIQNEAILSTSSQIYMEHRKTKKPSLIDPPLGPHVQGNSSTDYNFIKHEDMTDNEVTNIKDFVEQQYVSMVNICEEKMNVNSNEVEYKPQQRDASCHVPNHIGTLAKGVSSRSGPYEYFFSNNVMFDNSVITQTGEEQYIPTCTSGTLSKCECTFSDQCNLWKEIRTCTTVAKPFKCGLCNYKAPRKARLLQHIRTHTGDKPFKCGLCHYRGATKDSLVRHIRIHTGEKPFKCEFCEYRAASSSHLGTHIRAHKGEKPYKCVLCNYSASEKSNLVRHIRTHNEEKPFKCEFCDYRTVEKFALLRHIRTHTGEKPFKCELCEYSASTKYYLMTHIRTHMGEKPFKCEICDYCASRKPDLVRHSRTHTREKPYKCDLCHYSASLKDSLVRHGRIRHGRTRHRREIIQV